MTKPKLEWHERAATTSKPPKRRISDTLQTIINHDSYDLVNDHDFLAPYEICPASIGLLSILVNRHISDVSFSKLYHLSTKVSWDKLFTQDRQKLKPNDISVSKCIVFNRLLHECLKNTSQKQIHNLDQKKDASRFAQQTKLLYDAIKSRMATDFPPWTSQDLFKEVRRWQDIQCRRRLFYFNHEGAIPLPGLLMLQKAATNWCHCLLNYYRQNRSLWETDGRQRFVEHFQHSFIIVGQPTGSEGAAATQYVKSALGHFAKLNTRIICLLDPTILQNYIDLSDIDVILYPLNREANDKKEKQPAIKWEIRQVLSAEGVPVSVYCAEVLTLQLGTNDPESKRLPLNSTLCQLEFRLKIKVKDSDLEESIVLTSQPFGICSHAQYFPKFVAQIFLYEMKQVLGEQNPPTDPNIITEFVRRYYTRMTGFELTDHTDRYLREVFAQAIDDVKSTRLMHTLDHVYEDILTKIISQIDFLIMHPVLLLMYDDGLFLGICSSLEVDRMLEGTREQPHLLLRFNTLIKHQWNSHALVRLIIHDGDLKRASFDSKSFVNELCRLICESINEKTKQAIVLSAMSQRHFSDFKWYFHEELYRMNKMSPPSSDAYDPLLPILWMTMRQSNDQPTTETDAAWNSTAQRIKRTRSDSFPKIESVTSGSQSSPINIIVHVDSNDRSLIPSNQSRTPGSTGDKSVAEVKQVHDVIGPTTSKRNRQWIIEMPEDISISPEVVFRYLGEQFSTMVDNQHDGIPTSYFIRPDRFTTSLVNTRHVHSSERITSPVDRSPESSNSSAELAKASIDSLSNDAIQQIKVKEEPYDLDYDTVSNKMVLH